ncbi:MAG: NAD(P)H-hydrate dehydratase [Desulfovibrionaceae bacterium]
MPFYDPLPSPAEMAAWDRQAIEAGVRNEMLMENASREALAVLRSMLGGIRGKRVLLFAGPGNNGGDAIALARHLHDQDANVLLLHTRPKSSYKGVSGYHMRLATMCGVSMLHLAGPVPALPWRPDAVVDGLLGTGFKGSLRGGFAAWIDVINYIGEASRVLALDIPSGLNGLTGEPQPKAVRAHATVTFHAAKQGLVLPTAAPHVGQLHVRAIGIPKRVVMAHPASCGLITGRVAALLPKPDPAMDKFAAGRVAVAGGSAGLTGAPLLAALGAYRAGAGLVHVACPEALGPVIKADVPEVMTMGLGPGEAWSASCAAPLMAREDVNVLVVGPGLGREPGARAFLDALLRPIVRRHPMVLDADGLYWLSQASSLYEGFGINDVLTPHEGEMARLMGVDRTMVSADRAGMARALAEKSRVTVVLKGAATVVAAPGRPVMVSPFAAPTLAVGGSGDVLAGVLAAIMARGIPSFEAACLGVYWHGYCGMLLTRAFPMRGNTARDIVETLPTAIKEMTAC